MRIRDGAAIVAVAAVLAGCATLQPTNVSRAGQHADAFQKTITKTVGARYWLYLPPDYGCSKEKRWPMVLFLHGAGERGSDLEEVKRHGPPKIVQYKDLPFVIVSPQCPEDEWWDSDTLMALIDEVIAEYRIDPDRVYVTGLSMGGYGTWRLAFEYPDRFAAIAPICGRAMWLWARKIQHIPVWAFHGAKDEIVPLEGSQKIVEELKRLGADARLTVYPDAGHDSWTETYDNPELWEWFLQHRRAR